MNPNRSVTSKLSDSALVLIIVVLMLISFAVGLGWEKKSNKSKQDSTSIVAPAGWSSYSNKDYNFGFIYPNSFGKPLVDVKKGNVGESFHITFPSSSNKDQALELNMSSSDYKDKICTPDKKTCNDVGSVITKDFITGMLNSSDQTIVVQDATSFAMVVGDPARKQSVVGLDQIVDLKKAKINAVSLQLTKTGGDNCPRDKFVSDAKSKCVVQKDYDTLNQIAKSIKDI